MIDGRQHDGDSGHSSDSESIVVGLLLMMRDTWHLGFTCFGGPAVHFKIVRLSK